jgi:glc operon protein GlcG
VDTRATRSVTYEAAAGLVQRAVAHGAGPLSVAVVDPAGVLLAFARTDGAPAFSVDFALAKARTAAAFGRPTADMEGLLEGRQAFATGFIANGGWFVARGGAPIIVDGACVGAVGVSGNDAEVEDRLARELATP